MEKQTIRTYSANALRGFLFPQKDNTSVLCDKFQRAGTLELQAGVYVSAHPAVGDSAAFCQILPFSNGIHITFGYGHRLSDNTEETYKVFRNENAVMEQVGTDYDEIYFRLRYYMPHHIAIEKVSFFNCSTIEPKTDDEKEDAFRYAGTILQDIRAGTVPDLPRIKLDFIEKDKKMGGQWGGASEMLALLRAAESSSRIIDSTASVTLPSPMPEQNP